MSVTLTPRALPSLTGLRWCAALAVWAYHLRNVGFFSGRSEELLSRVVGGGDTGVSLFFVLSGFVLAWSHRDETSPQRFWWARIARIAPLHLTALALAVAVVAPVVPEIVSPSRGSVVANALLISAWRPDWWQAGNPVSWSLVCEAAFYATFPLLTLVLRRVSTTALAVVAVAAVVATFAEPLLGLHAVQAVLPIPVDAGHSPIARFPEFLLGVAVARLMRTGAWRGAPLALAVPLAAVGYAAATAEPSSPWHLSGFTVVGYGLLVTALARIDLSGRRSPLASAPMRWFGELSFAFYLVHLLVLQRLPTVLPVDPRGRAAVLHALLALVVATALAAGLHHGVELPARAVLLGRHQRRSAPYGGRRSVRNRVALIPVVRWKNRLKFVASVKPRRSAIRATGRSVYPSRRCASSAIRRSISCFGLVPFPGPRRGRSSGCCARGPVRTRRRCAAR